MNDRPKNQGRINGHKNHTYPDLIVCDVDNTLTHVNSIAARFADANDRWNIPVMQIAFWSVTQIREGIRAVNLNGRFTKAAKETLIEKISQTRDGAQDFLKDLQGINLPVILLSNAPKRWSNMVLQRGGLVEGYEAAHATTGLRAIKNDLNFIRTLAGHTALAGKRATVWVVGDGYMDMRFADRATGMTHHDFIPISFAGTPAAQVIERRNLPGMVFDNFVEMTDYLRQAAPKNQIPIHTERSSILSP